MLQLLAASLLLASATYSDASTFSSSSLHLQTQTLSQSLSLSLPEIKYADLVGLDGRSARHAVQQLTETGAAQITGIPSLAKTRRRALEELAHCLRTEHSLSDSQSVSHSDSQSVSHSRSLSVPAAIMADGSMRLSVGAASVDGKAGEMTSVCGEAADKLRSSVDSATFLLFRAMDWVMRDNAATADDAAAKRGDKLKQDQPLVMGPSYHSFTDLMKHGEHLEHLHSYFAPQQPTFVDATLDYHVDAGLMIAMTTGYYADVMPSDVSGLYLKLNDNSERKVVCNEDSIVILMGNGAEKWLAPVLGKPFRGVPHKLVVDLPMGGKGTRSWYGKMYLPPGDAIIPQQQMNYNEFNKLMIRHAPSIATLGDSYYTTKVEDLLPSACGSSETTPSSRMMTANDDNCGVGELWCWARCMSTSSLPCGDKAVCWNSDTNELSPGDEHCSPGSACNPTCFNEPSNATSSGYCVGTGTSMFMEGFVSIVNEGKGETECVNLWFSDWTLDSKLKYGFACIGVFLFCIFIQYLHTLRSKINELEDKNLRVLLNVGLYGLNVTCGYFVMLVAMTYSVELFSMVCVGMTVGYGIFHGNKTDSRDGVLGSESVHQPLIKSAKYAPPTSNSSQINKDNGDDDYGNCCADTA